MSISLLDTILTKAFLGNCLFSNMKDKIRPILYLRLFRWQGQSFLLQQLHESLTKKTATEHSLRHSVIRK